MFFSDIWCLTAVSYTHLETVNNAVATPVSQSIMGVSDMLYMQARCV